MHDAHVIARMKRLEADAAWIAMQNAMLRNEELAVRNDEGKLLLPLSASPVKTAAITAYPKTVVNFRAAKGHIWTAVGKQDLTVQCCGQVNCAVCYNDSIMKNGTVIRVRN